MACITQAYNVLRDPMKRNLYHIGGASAVMQFEKLQGEMEQPSSWLSRLSAMVVGPEPLQRRSIIDILRSRHMDDIFDELSAAVNEGNPTLPEELVQRLRLAPLGFVADAVSRAITTEFRCEKCAKSIDEGLNGLCTCFERSAELTHHRVGCCALLQRGEGLLDKVQRWFWM